MSDSDRSQEMANSSGLSLLYEVESENRQLEMGSSCMHGGVLGQEHQIGKRG